MEINPRFQASSFLISLYLQKYCSMDIAELHYLAATKRKIGGIHLDKIEKSFLNCNEEQEFADFSDYQVIDNGYFKENNTSYYRKVFNRSILLNKIFENID